MEERIAEQLEEQDKKLEAIYASVEKTRKYFLVIVWVTVIAVLLPFLALLFIVPSFVKNYTSGFEALL